MTQAELFALLGQASEAELLRIGRAVCYTDFAVRNYRKPGHPKFHHNRPALEKAIRRAYARGAFNHREAIEASLRTLKL